MTTTLAMNDHRRIWRFTIRFMRFVQQCELLVDGVSKSNLSSLDASCSAVRHICGTSKIV